MYQMEVNVVKDELEMKLTDLTQQMKELKQQMKELKEQMKDLKKEIALERLYQDLEVEDNRNK